MTAFVGRDVTMEFAIASEDASSGSLSYLDLGMMRQKSMKTTWSDVDTTADDSPDYTKTSLVTFKEVAFSGDGVSYTDAIYNQAAFKAQVINPSSSTGNQPKVWFRMTGPDGVYEGPFIVTEWSDERGYADASTWSMSAKSNGAVTFTPA